ncbi:hypothetical protein BLEM_0013 [Bifidobacterium lemurum]|uniref:Uncharacterized protein n=1 Tax=Bifidobacterium lemurum TaxID=1603886 RepID=A0A261FVV7_9BIFI|nr:hypothetical protein [Bifidobacterium lemurum]OZG63310.1 hypothetical protein BLEM_0013 [Bifidobacterium lemurum]QOL34229.1 hypothetical protein BL8807_11010 [Bifidobacterium lemurum]
MSRTWKDKPYKHFAQEAARHGFIVRAPMTWHTMEGDADTYLWRCGYHPSCMFWYDKKQDISYGNPSRVRAALNEARNLHNNGEDIRDWDDPVAYQRRRIFDWVY